MEDVYIVEAVRSPIGKRGKGLAGLLPADLLGAVQSAADVLEQVVSANGKAIRASFELGRMLEGGGQTETALDHYRRAWISGQEIGQVSRFRMGVLFGRSGRADSARVALEAFIARWKGNPALLGQARQMLAQMR